ncbi:MAG: metallopeptidase TldD-related protein, partial [Gammaproteobacteria bacterium]|nr:metallopeptidase TldD-related protein [Gammaproteobacteria bacterium]
MADNASARRELNGARLSEIAEQVLEESRRHGATSAEASVSDSRGLSVTARMGEVETVEHNRDKSLVVTVYVDRKTGSASSSDFSPAAIADTARAACTIAKYTANDPCTGLADADQLARDVPELDLNHPWELSVDQAIALALTCEDRARKADKRITNSEGATVSSHEGIDVYANTLGFMEEVAATRHSISCAVVGSADGKMQRDYWYTAARDPAELDAPDDVGRIAAQRTLRRLGAQKIPTRETPVVFEAPVAGSLLSHFVNAIRGNSLYRKASFLLGQLNQSVFAPHIRIHEQPHLKKAMGSAP